MNTLKRATMIIALFTLPMTIMAEEAQKSPADIGPKYDMRGSGYETTGPGNYEFCEECGTYHKRGHYGGYNVIPEKEAREKFESFVSKHLKGFTITKMEKERMLMGVMYWVVIKDKSGNEMELHMNPWGYIRGPFIK
ncbi:MAG: hypothetical protein JW682_03760 [Campylobacterales bacterium]|nr:hypothetical protein [Campylobacterales bacterium]HEO99324.1 hypothetical protein [Campylobacterota bacterium]